MDFEFIETEKLGGNWSQEFMVARKKVVYLRIVGDGTDYQVMTATAARMMGAIVSAKTKSASWGLRPNLSEPTIASRMTAKIARGAYPPFG